MILILFSDALAQVTENGFELSNIFKKFKVDIDDYKKVIDNFKTLDFKDSIYKLEDGKANWDAITKEIGGCNDAVLSYFKTLDDGNGTINNQAASIDGLTKHLEKSGNGFISAASKATLLNSALNAGIFLAVSFAIQAVATGIDHYIHRVDRARERTAELFDEFQQRSSSLSDHKQVVAESAGRYTQLSQGVDLSTNENRSLATQEYEEFLSINRQLADSFPGLTKGFDENGNAILALGSKGMTAKEHLEELIRTEEDLNNFKTAQGLEESFAGVCTYIEEAVQASSELDETLSDSNEALSHLQEATADGIKLSNSPDQLLLRGKTDNKAELDYLDALTDSYQEFRKSLDGSRRYELDGLERDGAPIFDTKFAEDGTFEIYSQAYRLTPDERQALETIIKDNVSEAGGALSDSIDAQAQELQAKVTQGENAWRDFIPSLVSGMRSKQTFKDLDPGLQDAAVQLVENLDSSYASAMKAYSPDPYAYIRDNFIVPMGNLNDSDKQKLQSGIAELFKLDAGNLSQNNQKETEKYISTIAALLEKTPSEIRVMLGFDIQDELDRYKEALAKAKHQLGGYRYDNRGFEANNATGSKLDDFWSENVLTEEDQALWQTVTAGITDAKEAMDAYTEARKKANGVEIDTLSFDDAFGRLENIARPVMDAVENAWSESFNDDGTFDIDPDKALGAVSAVKNAIESVNSNKALGVTIDTSSLETLAGVLSDTSSTADEVQQAYSGVAGALMDSLLPALQNMDASQLGMFQSFMQGMGILNAEELIIQQLGYSYSTYTAAKEAAAGAGMDLADATTEDVLKFAGESAAAEEDKIALLEYYQYKIIASGATIDTDGSITQLLSEYEQLGINCEKLKEYLGLHGAEEGSKVDMKYRGFSSSTEGYDTGAKTQPKLPAIPKGAGGKPSKTVSDAAKSEADALSGLNSEMDKLQSSYKSLCDIRDTYNQNGKITVDQYQELTNMGFTFLSQLVDENGQLGLNASAFERLSQAKLEEMQIQMARNAADTINGLKTEAAAVEYLTYANEQLRNAALGAAEAELEAAVVNARRRGGSQAEAASQIYQGYQAAKQMAGKVDFSFTPASSPAVSPEKTESPKKEASYNSMDAYNREKSLLEHMLALDQISKAEYYEKLLALARSSFEGDEEHQDQIWDAEESYHDYLESIKETFNWIEVFLENLSRKTSALIDKAGKFISWSKKNAMINRAVKATDRQIAGQNSAYVYYAEKARRVGLSNSYINKIQNGTLTMEDMQNESLSGKIEKYQEWYEKMTACADTVSELYDQERDLIRQKLDNVLEHYGDLDSYMSSIVSKMDSFISLTDDMGRRSSLTDLLEQFAAVNEQAAHFQSQTGTAQKETEKNLFESSQRVKDAEEKEKQELTDSLDARKTHVTSGIKDTGTYHKLLKDIAKASLAEETKKAELKAAEAKNEINDNDSDAVKKRKEKNIASKKTAYEKAQKKRAELEAKKEQLENSATANTIVEYARLYDTAQTLLNRKKDKEAQGKTLSEADAKKLADTQARMAKISSTRTTAIKELENRLAIVKGEKDGETQADRLTNQLAAIVGSGTDGEGNPRPGSGIEQSATYQKLLKDIADKQAAFEKEEHKYDGKEASQAQLNAQKKNLDKMRAQLAAYNEKKAALEAHATAGTIAEYSKIYDSWRKLQDKLDNGKVLSTAEWKNYNTYSGQLKQFAKERDATVKSLKEQLEKIQNPGDKAANIKREFEEASEGIRESYKAQIDAISSNMHASTQYKNLLANKQRLENKRDSEKGLTTAEEKNLRKYTAQLEALEKGATGDNIADYMKTWEQWYTLQLKREDGKTLSEKEAATYDSLKSRLEEWSTQKQSQISDLLSLMEDDLEKLRKTTDENLADAESEANSYYSKVYGLAKQIAEYNLNSLNEQLSCLDAYISYYSDLVSLYDRFSGDKLASLLTDLDEDAFSDQIGVYEKYLETLTSKYDATLSQINEYKQLLEGIDTNDFQSSMDLFQKAMDSYKASGNTEMADRLQAVLDVLNERAVDADNWGEYADLWASEWEQALADAKSGLIDTADSIQEINDALREVRFSDITDAIEELNRADGVLSSMSGLIQDAWLYDGDGLSEYGTAKAALLVSQLENAQNKAEEYLELTKKIQENRDTYASDTAYQEALAEASQNYYDTLSDAASLENAIVDLMRQAQEEEVSGWKDIISARKEALQAKKSYYDYDRSLKEKNKNIDSLRAELAALSEIDTAQAKARKAKLEADLAQAEEDRENARMEHEYSISMDALDDYAKTLEEALDDSTKTVQETLESQKEVIEEAKELYRTSTDAVEETMQKVTDFYRLAGEQMETFLTSLPDAGISLALRSLPDSAGTLDRLPSSGQESAGIVNHYDALLRVDGNVDRDALPGLQEILEKSYRYTTQKQYGDLKKIGYALH